MTSGGSPADPLWCNDAGRAPTFPCNMPDDGSWSRAVLTQRTDSLMRPGSGGNVTVTGTTGFSYQVPYPRPAQMCSTCVAGFYWGSQTDAAMLDFYDGKFFGFAQASVQKPDGAVDVHRFLSTEGWGLYDTSQVACSTGLPNPWPCHNSPYSDLPNAAHGHEYELDQYATDGSRLLKQVRTQWQASCPPPGVSGSPPANGNFLGNLVAEVDLDNPVMVCEVRAAQEDTYQFEGSSTPAHETTFFAYDGLGRQTSRTRRANPGIADASGHAGHGSSAGALSFGVAGLVSGEANAAMGFDGASSAVQAPAQSALQGASARSLELWFSTGSGAQQPLLDTGNTGSGIANQAFLVELTQAGGVGGSPSVNTPGLTLDLSGQVVYLPGLNLGDGRPHHLVVTLTGSTVTAFVDGATPSGLVYGNGAWSGLRAQPFALAASPNTAANPLLVGLSRMADWAVGSTHFSGVLDELAVYDRVLSASQVLAHRTAPVGGYRAAVLQDAPVAYYRLDDAAAGSPPVVVERTAYVQNDAVAATSSSAAGTYLLDRVALQTTEDAAGARQRCAYTSYDGQPFAQGASAGLTRGKVTRVDRYTSCAGPSGQISATATYDASGNRLSSTDPDGVAGDSAHKRCTAAGVLASACTTYDATFGMLPIAQANALNQMSTTAYAVAADSSGHGGRGSWSGGVSFGAPSLVSGDTDTAMGFDGSGGTGTVGLNLPGVDTTTGHQVTVEFWMKWPGGGGTQFPFSFHDYGLVWLPGTGLGFGTMHSDIYGVGASAVPANTPVHVVAVFTNGGVSGNLLYINGVQQTLSQLTGTPLSRSVTPDANISGVPRTPVVQNFRGVIDEVAVYNGVLASDRVRAHFNAGAAYVARVVEDSPLAYYRLDENATRAGFGLWPGATTDANGQSTFLTYDALGRETARTLPGEAAGLTTLTTSYTVWCSGTAAQVPCVEVDRSQRLNATTVIQRAFYDGMGHVVETRSPAPGGQDVVQYAFYDPLQRLAFRSVPYLVPAYTGGPGPAAFSTPQTNQDGTTVQPGTTYTYDGLGRQTSVKDALSNTTTSAYKAACAAPGTQDASCHLQTLTTDPRQHQSATLVDALGRTAYRQRFNGGAPSPTLYASAAYTYDAAGDLTRITHPDANTQTSIAYDTAGRRTSMTDPDRGAATYTYDPDGNLTKSVDARGAAGTVFAAYDGLDRPLWHNTTNTPTGAYQTFAYDSTTGGNRGVGRLTAETFSDAGMSGGYAHVYDGRGRQTVLTETVAGTSYQLQTTYDDAGDILTQTYPTGEVVTDGYTPEGWLSGVSTTQGVTTTALLSGATYTGQGGAFGEMTGATLGGGAYGFSAQYDELDRLGNINWLRGSVVFGQARTFDAAGNVATITTTLPAGTDSQAFCYDDQDRLTWAGATGTPPCTGTTITPGTLSAAQYTQSFTYDPMGRLRTGPGGSYAYTDSAHVHAATAIGVAWTATYDAAGDMTCRAPTTSTTCASATPNGALLTYGPEGTLTSWQDRPTDPTTTAAYLYDNQGQRVAQRVTQGGNATTTVYIGDVEQVATTGAATTTTSYYHAAGRRIALAVNGTISYLASDALGSISVALNAAGSATASQLFAPYGGVRYSSGTVPTDIGFTGQRSDTASGLGYFGARYYDPVAGQFTSADTLLPGGGFDLLGLSRFAYVDGDPINRTDPTGHKQDEGGGDPSCHDVCTPPTPPGSGNDSGGGCQVTCVTSGGPGAGGPTYTPPPDKHSGAGSGHASGPGGRSAAGNQETGCSFGNLMACANGIASAILSAVSAPVYAPTSEENADELQVQAEQENADWLNEQLGPSCGDLASHCSDEDFALQVASLIVGGRSGGRAPEYVGGQLSEAQAMAAAEHWLGPAYTEVSPGRYVSADGMRQVRYGSHEVSGSIHHIHFESYDKPYHEGGRVIENTRAVILP